MPDPCPSREASLSLVREFVSNEGLIRHMLAVEAAVRAYARRFGADEHLWGTAALLHDFDYERWPHPPDHPLQGSQILRERKYPEEVIYAILSHADYLQDEFPRRSPLDKTLYACDELCGFLMACALVPGAAGWTEAGQRSEEDEAGQLCGGRPPRRSAARGGRPGGRLRRARGLLCRGDGSDRRGAGNGPADG